AWGELYTALQQGVVEGAENNAPSFHLSRHYEICKYYSLDEHNAVPDVFIVSLHLWNQLTADQQQWVQEAADASAVYQRELWSVATAEALDVVAKAGVEIIRPDKTLFAEKTKSIVDDLRGSQPRVAALADQIREIKP